MQGRGASLRSLLVEVALGEVEPLPAQELHAEGVEEALWIGNTYLDDSGRDSPASLNSTGDM